MGKYICDWQSSSDLVAEQIMDYIHRENLQPGDILPKEKEFAEMFQVSPRVIREAVSRLRGKELLTAKQRLGTQVNKPDVFKVVQKMLPMTFLTGEEKQDLLTLRLVLEQGLPDLLFRNLNDSVIADLEATVHMEELGPSCWVGYPDYDYEFHKKVYEATQCHTLVDLHKLLWSLRKQRRDLPSSAPEIICPVEDAHQAPPVPEVDPVEDDQMVSHRDLLNAIIGRDAQAFRRLSPRHWEHFFLKNRS